MINFEIQSHRPLRELVYEELRNLILSGEIKPGTRMMEIELADSMGVSRTPIREAIRKLEKEGLVTIEPRKGAYVSTISMNDIVNIIQIRGTLEGLAATLAATRIKEIELMKLKEASQAFDRAVEEGNTKEMISNDTLFHHIIVEASGNDLLIKMVTDLQEIVLRFRYLYYKDFKRAEKMPPEHANILRAIETGSGETARSAAEFHINSLRDMIIMDSNELFGQA